MAVDIQLNNGGLAFADGSIQPSAPAPQIINIAASVAASALTISTGTLSLAFRSTTLGSGATATITGTPANLVVPSTATLGTVSAQQSRLVVLALNNAGTIELAAVNISGGNDLTETGVISTTAIAAASNAANVIYSTTARTNVAYRVVGYVESTQATAGTWATAPSTVQGYGGQALAAMSSPGYGQSWQDVKTTPGRAFATTYYNTTGKEIKVSVVVLGTAGNILSAAVNGLTITVVSVANTSFGVVFFTVPAGHSYLVTEPNATLTSWNEER